MSAQINAFDRKIDDLRLPITDRTKPRVGHPVSAEFQNHEELQIWNDFEEIYIWRPFSQEFD